MAETVAVAIGVGLLTLMGVKFVVASHRARCKRQQRAAVYQRAHDYLARGGRPLRLVPEQPKPPPAWPVHWSVYAGPHEVQRGVRPRPTSPPVRQFVARPRLPEREPELDASVVFGEVIRLCSNDKPASAGVRGGGEDRPQLVGGGGEFGGAGASSFWDSEPLSDPGPSGDDQ